MARQGSIVKLIIVIIVILVVVGYVIFNSRFLRGGPSVEIYDLIDGEVVSENIINVRGLTKNISFISLNGKHIFVDENGEFDEKLLITNRLNPIVIYAKDKFNKEVTKNITLIYKSDMPDIDSVEIDMIEATTTQQSLEQTATSSNETLEE